MDQQPTQQQKLVNRRGLTLLTSMVLLVVMSLLGVVAVNLAVQETHIAQNYAGAAMAVAWAEAGAEAARLQLVSSSSPSLNDFDCPEYLPFEQRHYHYYPDSASRRVRYCIELIRMELATEASSGRTSRQELGAVAKTYYYKVDAYSLQPDQDSNTGSANDVVLRHVQTIEQQTRATR